jgi:hypothetical protein
MAKEIAQKKAGKKGWSIPVAPLLFVGAAGCFIYGVALLNRRQIGPQPDKAQEAAAWAKGFLLTPPVTPRPGARGIYEDIELPVERTVPVN